MPNDEMTTDPVIICLKVYQPNEAPEFFMDNTAQSIRRMASQLAEE
ncbi:hypothetical protein M1N23_02000 [Dehalococcoidia bacterium]|nr:hypothetical protein [Dehalococcoidia bacterium]